MSPGGLLWHDKLRATSHAPKGVMCWGLTGVRDPSAAQTSRHNRFPRCPMKSAMTEDWADLDASSVAQEHGSRCQSPLTRLPYRKSIQRRYPKFLIVSRRADGLTSSGGSPRPMQKTRVGRADRIRGRTSTHEIDGAGIGLSARRAFRPAGR